MIDAYFGHENGLPRVPYRATCKDCTCCVIKPHALIDGNVGAILELISISNKYFISAMAMFSVKLANAEEFYEVYKGVLPEYEVIINHYRLPISILIPNIFAVFSTHNRNR